MARSGLYKTDVEKARASLLAQGKRASVDAVRVALGNTGSKSTIHRYLKELDEEDGQGSSKTVAVSDALQDLITRLAERLHAEADARVTDAQARFDTQLADKDAVLVQHTQEAAALSTQLQRTEVALAEEREAHSQSQAIIQGLRVSESQLQERVAGLSARLAEQEAHVNSLEQKHSQAREALEHFRAATKEQRDQEHRRHEHQVQGLQVELRQAHEALTGKNHELLQVNRDAARLTEQVNQGRKELQQALDTARTRQEAIDRLMPVQDELLALQARWKADAAALDRLQNAMVATEGELALERQARSKAESELAGANARLTTLEAVFARWQPAAASQPSVIA